MECLCFGIRLECLDVKGQCAWLYMSHDQYKIHSFMQTDHDKRDGGMKFTSYGKGGPKFKGILY
jgi:hypothetical protein